MSKMEEFKVAFHSLDGTSIQEKRKNFNSYLKSLEKSIDQTDELTNLICCITPESPTEKVFKTEIMIKFQKHDLLIDELKTNDAILVKKLLKNWKLFGDIFSNIDVQNFVENILPNLSYSLRLKLLNGIYKNVKNDELMDQYFSALEKKYGLSVALTVLPSCSMDLIKSKIKKCHVMLSNRHLIAICKKDKQFLEYYFDILKKDNAHFDFDRAYKKTLKFFAKMYTCIYWQLHEKYNFSMEFGKHMTPKMFRSNEEVLKYGSKYIGNLHVRQLYKTATKDKVVDQLLLNVCPERHEEFCARYSLYTVQSFIKLLPKSQQYFQIVSLFHKKYGKNLLDYSEYITEDFMKTMPIKEREDILDIKVKENEELMYLYHPSKSIPMIKRQLQHSSRASNRLKLICLIEKTCAVHEDREALLEVLQYIFNRYKNDTKILGAFFTRVTYWPDLIKLDERYWKYIADMAKILKMSKQPFNDNFYVKYICHMIEYNKPCQEQCVEFLKELFQHDYAYIYYNDHRAYERRFVEELGQCIHLLKDHKRYQLICVRFLNYLVDYNSRNKSDQVSLNNYSHLFEELKTDKCSEFVAVIKSGLRDCDTEFWHDLFWKNFKDFADYEILSWYLKHHPEKIAENIDKLLRNCLDLWRIKVFLNKIRKLSDKSVCEKMKIYVLNSLNGGDYKMIASFFKVISIIAPESLLEFTPLLPNPDAGININKGKEKLKLNKILIKNLHKSGNYPEVLPLILKFCNRDYFRYASTPLQCITYNTPEAQVMNILSKLSDKSVSIRKHVLILARKLLAFEEFIKLLQEFGEKEKSTSIRNIIFEKTLRHLKEKPSDSLWALTKKNMKLINKNDREMYDFLLKFKDVPQEYLPEYIEIIFVEIASNPDREIQKKRFQLFRYVPVEVIDKLDIGILKRVIKETACLEDVSSFHWKCVFSTHGEKQEELFRENFETLEIFVRDNRLSLSKDSGKRSIIRKFLERFLETALELKEACDLIEKFIAMWTSILHPNTFCTDYLTLLLMDLYFKSNFDAYQTGIKTNELLYNYTKTHGSSILPLFSKHLALFLNRIPIQKREQMIKFIEGFMLKRSDENIYVVVMHLLNQTSLPKDFFGYSSSLKIIEDCKTPVVKYHYDLYLAEN